MINLYTYQNAFEENKMRPGFRVAGILFVLSTKRPRNEDHIVVKPRDCSGHFASLKPLYVVRAKNQAALRYNNISGGTLEISSQSMLKVFGVDLADYEILNSHTNMSKLNLFVALNGHMTIGDAAAFVTAHSELDNAQMLTLLGLPDKISKIVNGASVQTNNFAEVLEAAQGWQAQVKNGSTDKSVVLWAGKHDKAAQSLALEYLAPELPKIIQITAEDALAFANDPAQSPEELQGMVVAAIAALTVPEDNAANVEIVAKFFGCDAVTAPEAPTPDADGAAPAIDAEALAEAIQSNQVAEGDKVADPLPDAAPEVETPANVETAVQAANPTIGTVVAIQPALAAHIQKSNDRLEKQLDRMAESFADIRDQIKDNNALIQVILAPADTVPAEDATIVE